VASRWGARCSVSRGKNPIASALWLVVTLFSIAAMFVLLDAQFLGRAAGLV